MTVITGFNAAPIPFVGRLGSSPTDDGKVPNIQHQHDGTVRTTMNCHACSHAFLALIDHSVDAVIQIHCPYCGHKHGRQISAGVMTEIREGPGDAIVTFQEKVKVWKLDDAARPELAGKVATSTTCEFLRHRWLNLVQGR